VARAHWLVKSEPTTYAWERFVRERGTRWDGVRNPLARKHLAGMKTGDLVLFYHSGEGKAVVGTARVVKEAYPDPSAAGGTWLAVDLAPLAPLPRPVALAEIKAERALADLALVRQPRLSVMPVPKQAYERILALARQAPRGSGADE
jgi:predicted RNA-binding protein with PUA-like domain